jgi:hypothetical protein
MLITKTVQTKPVDPKRPTGPRAITGITLTLHVRQDERRTVVVARGSVDEDTFLRLHRETANGRHIGRWALKEAFGVE